MEEGLWIYVALGFWTFVRQDWVFGHPHGGLGLWISDIVGMCL